MPYSIQRAVSDGTLQQLGVSLAFFDRRDITAYVGGDLTFDFVWLTNTTIRFNYVIPAGVEVMLRRSTDMSDPRHIFSAGSPFTYNTLDENFEQILRIAQEAVEGLSLTGLNNNLDMGGYRITRLGDPVGETDGMNLRYTRNMIERAVAGSTGGLGWFHQSGAAAIERTFQDKLRDDLPTLEDFGGSSNYYTPNDLAYQRLIAAGHTGMKLGRGAYRFNNTPNFKTGFTIAGVASPTLGFGTIDSKQFLRPGYKHLIDGSMIVCSGTGTTVFNAPQRVDEYATMRPCVALSQAGAGSLGTKWSGFAIVQDMNCFDSAGNVNKPGAEAAADYDTGLLLNDVARTELRDVSVFGYFSKAGAVISSVSGNDDPDYNTWWGGSVTGRHGLALLGSNNGPAEHGLSGTRLFGTGLYTLDHHARGSMTEPERLAYYANANTWSCLYIDGDVNASSAEINGHEFHGCEIRTRANHAIRLDHAANVKFFGGVFEFSPYNIPNSDTPMFLGSVNVKRGIIFDGLRNNYISSIFNPNFVGLIPVPVVVIGDPLNGRSGVFHRDPAGGYSGVMLGSDGNIGDAAVQLTKDANNGNSGWRDTVDVSAGIPNQKKYEGAIRWAISTAGIMSVNAPANTDAAVLMSSNSGANIWALRAQVSSTGQLQFRFGGTSGTIAAQLRTNGNFIPGSDGVGNLGEPGVHWSNVYLSNAPIVSSDARLKFDISDIPESWLVAARNVEVKRYKMKSAVAEKGEEAARWHIGVIAQQVVEAFAEQGVDAFTIGIVGRDAWDDLYEQVIEEVLDAEGNSTGEFRTTEERRLVLEAGEALSVRYDELTLLRQAARWAL